MGKLSHKYYYIFLILIPFLSRGRKRSEHMAGPSFLRRPVLFDFSIRDSSVVVVEPRLVSC